MSLRNVVRLRLRALFRRDRIQREVEEELQFHLDMQVEENLRAGMAPEEARRQAVLLFGGIEGHKEESRRAQGLDLMGLRISWLDLKLGLRMLRKYPGLTGVAALALTIAFGLAAAWFEVTNDFVNPTIPLAEGDRIVAIRNWDAAAGSAERRSIHDFVTWRDDLESVVDLGAFVERERNLVTGDGWAEPVGVAEVTASAFRLARVPPLLGRPLLDGDEREGAPAVVVIGHDLWQSRFARDPEVVGRIVRLDETQATVVGVMPEGFAFPINHGVWTPLQVGEMPAEYARREGPAIRTFGRLAPGASLAEAQAELATIGRRATSDFPETHEHLRPQLLPYVDSMVDGAHVLHVGNGFFLLVLTVICANVAALVYARTATRIGEITVRSALGATRGRILGQLVAEALVLAIGAAVVSLVVVNTGMRWGMEIAFAVDGGGRPPFWWDPDLAPRTIAYVSALAVIAAVAIGVPPALRVTGRDLQPGLQRGAVGSSALRFGGARTAVIVVQVALSVAFLPRAFTEASALLGSGSAGTRFAADRHLSARIEITRDLATLGSAEGPDPPANPQAAHVYGELKERLLSEPGVQAVTMASRLPGMNHPAVTVEVEGGSASGGDIATTRSRLASVQADYFAALDIAIVEGRALVDRDGGMGSGAVVVSQAFARRFFGGASPIGRRVRFVEGQRETPAAWLEIVGVATNVPVSTDAADEPVVAFLPAAAEHISPVHVAIRVGGDPAAFVSRLRAQALATDPALRVYDVRPLDDVAEAERRMYAFFTLVFLLVGSAAVLLATAGIYSLVSFTVTQRTREIGIRSALGAQPDRIVIAVFSRVLAYLGLGIVAGGVLAIGLRGVMPLDDPGVLLGIAALMLAVGLLACIGPVRRALTIQPTEALRAGG